MRGMRVRLDVVGVPAAVAVSLCGLASAQTPGAATRGAQDLEEVIVTAGGSQVDLPAVFDGEQVARGARAGLLGNLDLLEAPFSMTAYTATLVREQQADSIGDVLQNDPSVRVAKGFGNFQEVYVIRGFPVFSDDMTYNGLYGILPRQFLAAEVAERVEVFRGANSFLNGAAPGGSGVGGAFNIVPKRAAATPLTRATLGTETGGQLYGALDAGRRFGANESLGLRLNLVRRDGETSVDAQERELSVVSLGLDHAGERLRFAADFGYQDQRIDVPRPQVTPSAAAPDAPDAAANFAQPWTFASERQAFGVVRGELDFASRATAWLAFGGRYGEEANRLSNPRATPAGATTATRFDNAREDEVLSADAGLRIEFRTGAVGHRLIASASVVDLDSRNAFAFSDFAGFAGNLYAPLPVAAPPATAFLGGVLADPLRTEAVRNASLAVADMLSFVDGTVLATVGLRRQDIETQSFNATTGLATGAYSDSAVTPTVALVWRLTGATSLYANYAESLQPGAIAPASNAGQPILNAGEILAPFRGRQVELGAKVERGGFGGTASLFQLERPNAIVENQVFAADGRQQTRGIEASAYGELAPGLRLLGGATFLDAGLARTQGRVNQGNVPIGVPAWQGNLNLEWDLPAARGVTFDARAIYTDRQFINATNTFSAPSSLRFDVGARWNTTFAGRGLTLRGRIENVSDDSYWASVGGFPGANYLVLAAPRTAIVSASMEF